MSQRTEAIESYHFAEALKSRGEALGARCGQAAITLLFARLFERLNVQGEKEDWSLWRSAIEEHEQDAHKDEIRHVLVDLCRDALIGYCRSDFVGGKVALQGVIATRQAMAVRIAIHVCSEQYGTYGDLFWEIADSKWFTELAYWHEIFWLIKKNFSRFSASARLRYLETVMGASGGATASQEEQEANLIHRRNLLHPASNQGDAEVDEMYQALVVAHGEVAKHPDFHYFIGSSSWVGERSPVSVNDLLQMSGDELRELMRSFSPAPNEWDGPSYRGLGENISSAVRAPGTEFPESLALFLDVHPAYQHGLIRGLQHRVADDKRMIPWLQVLQFMEELCDSEPFNSALSKEPEVGFHPNAHWVAGAMADLIKVGAKQEPNGMPDSAIDLAIGILIRLLAATTAELASNVQDAVSQAINSSRGRALETLINVALFKARSEPRSAGETAPVWKTLEPVMKDELETSAQGKNAEFATLGALYLPNLRYLAPDWVPSNFNRFFPEESDDAWRCAVQGFSYQHYMYDWIYENLSKGGHLRRILHSTDLPDSVASRALQFIGLAYLTGAERLEPERGGLLREIVADLRRDELCKLCWFFWTMRGGEEFTKEKRQRILEFWYSVAESLRKAGKTDPKLQSALSVLAVFIETPDARFEQLWIDAAPHAQVSHHGYILVEHLSRLASIAPTTVARVFLAALTGFLPDYKREQVIMCVEELASQGLVDDALRICNAYALNGSQLLKDTYEKLRALPTISQA